MIKKVS